MKLAKLRKQIDEIDRRIVQLLSERFKLTQSVSEYKKENNLSVLDANREQALLAEVMRRGKKLGLRDEFIDKLFSLILEESRWQQEKKMRKELMKKLQFVSKSEKKWKVIVGNSLIQRLPRLVDLTGYTKIGIVMDGQVGELYEKVIVKALEKDALDPLIFKIKPGEQSKSLGETSRIYEALLNGHFDRKSVLVAFGGGVVGDLTGFVAATYMRGIDVVQIPTTLLAQADAAIGGKTGVNFNGSKNIIGSFHQPQAIISDISLLKTLSKRELRSGLAEVVKYGLIKDKSIFELLERKGIDLSEDDLELLVVISTNIKGKIIEKDEQEKTGLRAQLNFGHTLGHAVESVGNGEYTHGEAISIGILFASKISYLLQMIHKSEYNRVVELVKKLNLPVACSLSRDELLKKIVYDKKSVNKQTRWVLLKGIGEAVSNQKVDDHIIAEALKEIVI